MVSFKKWFYFLIYAWDPILIFLTSLATTASINLTTVPTENGILSEDPWIKRGQNQFINTTAGETVTAVSERGSLTASISRGQFKR